MRFSPLVRTGILVLIVLALAPLARAARRCATPHWQESLHRGMMDKEIWNEILQLLDPPQTRYMGKSRSFEKLNPILGPGQRIKITDRLRGFEKRSGNRVPELIDLGWIHFKLGEHGHAGRIGGVLRSRLPDRPVGYVLGGHVLRAQGRPDKAKELIKPVASCASMNREVAALIRLLGQDEEKARQEAARKYEGERPWRPHESLDPKRIKWINQALERLGKTETGRDILAAVVPRATATVTLATLQLAGIDVRLERGSPVSLGRIEQARGKELREFSHIITLDSEGLGGHRAALPAYLGWRLDSVAKWKKSPERVSHRLLEQIGMVKAVWIMVEFQKQGHRDLPMSRFAWILDQWWKVWFGLLYQQTFDDDDDFVYGREMVAKFERLRDNQMRKWMRGPVLFWWLASEEAKQADRKVSSKLWYRELRKRETELLWYEDAAFRKKHGYDPVKPPR